MPGISVIDIIIVCTWGRRTNATKLDEGSVDACSSGMSATRPMESPPRGEESLSANGGGTMQTDPPEEVE